MTYVQGTRASDERLSWLERNLASAGHVTLADAAAALGVSEMTIRRDLTELEGRGTARRIRGGAKAVGPRTFSVRHSVNTRAKARLATKLSELVPSSGAVAFDASSTIMRLAGQLTGATDLTVITNGPDTFAALQGQPGVHPLLTGGRLDTRSGSLVGPLACRSAAQLSVERFFTSAAAVDTTLGPSEATLDEAEVKRQLAAMAGEVILALDSSKLDTRVVATSLEWDRIDRLVTELDPDDQRLEKYRRLVRVS